jgi:hypothetical protein
MQRKQIFGAGLLAIFTCVLFGGAMRKGDLYTKHVANCDANHQDDETSLSVCMLHAPDPVNFWDYALPGALGVFGLYAFLFGPEVH